MNLDKQVQWYQFRHYNNGIKKRCLCSEHYYDTYEIKNNMCILMNSVIAYSYKKTVFNNVVFSQPTLWVIAVYDLIYFLRCNLFIKNFDYHGVLDGLIKKKICCCWCCCDLVSNRDDNHSQFGVPVPYKRLALIWSLEVYWNSIVDGKTKQKQKLID